MINSPYYPNGTIENLAIGKIIEVDGTRVVAELDPTLSELSRVYAGESYPIGQRAGSGNLNNWDKCNFCLTAA